MQYFLVSSTDLDRFNARLRDAVNKGWTPYGELKVAVSSSTAPEGARSTLASVSLLYAQMMSKAIHPT